uniref:Amidohydrolase-related domain-containing protein n=1 Tax=Pyrodinium bahamense TaxID=73915 RepID=A0A7S0B6M8_9DINO
MERLSGPLSQKSVQVALVAVLVVVVLKLLRKRLGNTGCKWPLDIWIDTYREDAIDPDLEIIDPHHHLWDPRYHPKGWPLPLPMIQAWYATTKPAVINKQVLDSMMKDHPAAVSSFVGRGLRAVPFVQPYMGQELELDIRNRDCGKRGHTVVKTVYLECGWDDQAVKEAMRPVGEARMAEQVHAQHPRLCNAIVAGANLLLPDVEETFKAFPNTTIIIDHVAEPLGIGSYTREGTFPLWEKGIRELAKASKHVYVKLSGLGMCRTGFHFDDRPTPPSSAELAEAWGPYFRVVLEAFGVQRCMFASNFPVDKVSCDYTVMWNAFKLIAANYSAADKRALFHDNAKRVYRL